MSVRLYKFMCLSRNTSQVSYARQKWGVYCKTNKIHVWGRIRWTCLWTCNTSAQKSMGLQFGVWVGGWICATSLPIRWHGRRNAALCPNHSFRSRVDSDTYPLKQEKGAMMLWRTWCVGLISGQEGCISENPGSVPLCHQLGVRISSVCSPEMPC